ncbi:MAG: AsmA family protein, partial [Acidobacteriota bacterium]|nr:AsmA family protein [Acidobacteriota bacterium]
MKRPAKIALTVAGILLVLGIVGAAILQSQWLRERLREKIVAQLETSTGGKVDIGAFTFDWSTLTAEVHNLAIHGLEPSREPPLLRAAQVQVELSVGSLLNPVGGIDIASLGVNKPEVHLIVYPDGRTNVPAPRVEKRSNRSAIQTILDLKIGRLRARNGTFEVKSPGNAAKV